MQRSRDTISAVAAAIVTAAIARASDADVWLVVVLGCYGAGVSYGVRGMSVTLARWRGDQREWSGSLVTERVADGAHRAARGAQRAVADAVRLLRQLGEPALAQAIHEEFELCRARAAAVLAAWRASASPEFSRAADEGFLTGVTMKPRSEAPLRRFATFENTPSWLPRPLRAGLVRLLRGVDVVRLLHTPDVERRSLIVSLWLRAAFVFVAPFAAAGSFTGLVPFSGATGSFADFAYLVAVGFAAVTAMLAPQVADYTIGQPMRVKLLVVEQVIATGALIAAPCWPVAIFAAGAVNWIERPDWTLRKLLIWMALTYVPLCVAAATMGATGGEIALEAGIGIAVTAVMAGSYGLMFPATVTTYVGALAGSLLWRLRAFRAARQNRRDVEHVLDRAEAGVRRLGADDPRALEVLGRIAEARGRLADPRQLLSRRSRVLDVLCSTAITSIVPPEASSASSDLKAARIVAEPPGVGTLVIASAPVARRIERVIKRIVLEALDNGGVGALYSRLGLLDDNRIEITIANDLPPDDMDRSGFGTGGQWLARWTAGIPRCDVIERDFTSGETVGVIGEIFTVRLAVGSEAFEVDDVQGGK